MLLNESIIWILIQELFENDLLNIDELKTKYTLNEKQANKIKKIIFELYGEN